jgi:ceramide glucosyltransferase
LPPGRIEEFEAGKSPRFYFYESGKSTARGAAGGTAFCYSRDVYELFYLLVIVQIGLGLYSLWEGIEWLRMTRNAPASHAGFYAPVAALICPCKGVEPGLEDNLTALTRFDYPNYEIYFAVASSSDPCMRVLERVKGASQRPVHIITAGPPNDCGEKVNNLRRAVEALPESAEVMVFTDSDVRLSRNWLAKLVAPLQDPRIGATTTYRWVIPSGTGAAGFAGALASAWNAAIATTLGRPRDNFCWGGGTAIRRRTFLDAQVLDAWTGAVSDDFALTRALETVTKPIIFCPECLAPTLHPWTLSGLLEFTNRQILVTRVYSSRRWMMGAAAHLSYSLTLVYALIVIIVTLADGDPWIQLALVALVVPLLAAMKGAIRTVALPELLPEWKGRLNQWSWVWTVLAPFISFLFAWNFIASLLTRRIRWRGIRYELLTPATTHIIRR